MTRRVIRMVGALALALTAAGALATGSLSAAQARSESVADVGTVYAPISGIGSTWSANALSQWARNVFSNYHWQITYADLGSSAGRQSFATQGSGYDFAVSEIPYHLTNSDAKDPNPPRSFAYMPIVAGGTSFMYNLVIGGKRVTNLRLAGQTVADIFTGAITKWNDPEIAADNPALALPSTTIVPVVRSDGSGTTAQLTTWFRSQYPSTWDTFCVKVGRPHNCGITSNYPAPDGFKAQALSTGVAGYVAQSQYVGSITYVEYSYALNSHFPVAKLLNSAGYYNEPTAQNVAVGLLGSKINEDSTSQDYLTQDLSGVYTNPDPRTYPLSSYSYMLIPTALEWGFTSNKGLTLAAFTDYFLCEGQQQAPQLGYSPLPINLVQAGLSQVAKIPGGDPKNIDISKCHNPTFSADGSNTLANTAPQPPPCDKKGAAQCTTGTGGAASTSTVGTRAGSPTTSGGASNDNSAGTTSTTSSGTTAGDGVSLDGLSGGASLPLTIAGAPVVLPALTPWAGILGASLALVIVIFVVLVPPVVARLRTAPDERLRRRPRPRVPKRSPARRGLKIRP